jgi:hypothetical protein
MIWPIPLAKSGRALVLGDRYHDITSFSAQATLARSEGTRRGKVQMSWTRRNAVLVIGVRPGFKLLIMP